MKWHHPAWLRAIERRLPYQIALMHSKETVYLFARFPVRRDWLIELVYDALLESAFADDTPDDTPDETLCDTHIPAKRVADALNALERAGKLTSNGHLRTYGREVNV